MMSLARSLVLCWSLGSVLAGCGGEGGGADFRDVVVRDSAGVTIVESPAGSEAAAPVWVVDPNPIVRIGTIMGELPYQFGRIDGVTQLSDGRIVVLDGQARELRYFTPDGDYLYTVGRSGDGPGEIFPTGTVRIFPLPDDTLAVLNQQRITLFDSNGQFIETITSVYPSALGLLDHRGIIVYQSIGTVADPGYPDGLTVQKNHYVRIGLGDPVTSDSLTLKYSRQSWSSGGSTTVTEFSPDGQSFTFTSAGPSAYVPFTHPPISYVRVGGFAINDWQSRDIEVFDGTGKRTRILRVAGGLEPLTDERFRAMIDRVLGEMEPEARTAMEPRYAAMPAPATIPAYAPAMVSGMNRMLMGGNGELWIGRFDPDTGFSTAPGGTPAVWTAFDPEGRVAGTIHMPEGFTPFELTPEGVLGVYRDEYDVEYVQHVRVERPSES
jgi:hypothetical protein